jgi:hypothetical protein
MTKAFTVGMPLRRPWARNFGRIKPQRSKDYNRATVSGPSSLAGMGVLTIPRWATNMVSIFIVKSPPPTAVQSAG